MLWTGALGMAASALLFAIPASAPSWRGLGWRLVICIGLTLAAFLVVTGGRLSLTVPGGDADIGAGIVLAYALVLFGGGLLARTVSLTARRLGHPRPWSLWIEVLAFFTMPLLIFGSL